MIASIFANFLLILYGIKTFFSKGTDHHGFIIAFFLIFSSCIKLIPADIAPTSDIAMLLCFVLYAINSSRTGVMRKPDSLGKSILVFLIFICLRALFTFISGEDTLLHVLLTIRPTLFWLTYFIFCELSKEDFDKAWIVIKVLIILSIILSLLQYLNFNYLGYHSANFKSRIRIPFGAEFLFFWALLTVKENKLRSGTVILLCLILFYKNGSRFGIVLHLLMMLWILFNHLIKRKEILFIGLFAILGIFGLFWSSADFNTLGRFGEIKNDTQRLYLLANQSSEKFEYLESGKSATMLFRLALAKERILYLQKSPELLLFGVGSIYDDPKNENNRFNFYLGTIRSDRQGIHQIETVDISFVTVFFRYGLIGLILYVILLCRLFNILHKNNKNNIFTRSAYFVFLLYTFQFLGCCRFDYFIYMGLPLLIAGTINNENRSLLRNRNSKL